MNDKINCIIVDDEPLAHLVLEKHAACSKDIFVAGSFFSAVEAFSFIYHNKVDLMFLDVKMPGIKGTDFIKTLKNPPDFVFTTAYQEYALEGFELDAIDYLLKPVTFERFRICIEKYQRKNSKKVSSTADFISVKTKGALVKLYLKDILYAEAMKDYIKFRLVRGSLLTHMTMKALEAMLPAEEFVRVHRSFIVNRSYIEKLGRGFLFIGDQEIPIGELYKSKLNRLK